MQRAATETNQAPTAAPATPEIVVVGAACLDIKGRIDGQALSGTSNAGRVRITAGGCARNVAENLARLGVGVALLSVVCQDDFGYAILQQTERSGVNTDHVLTSCQQHSAAYLALLDPHGALIVGIDDAAVIAAITPAYIEQHAALLGAARLVMFDANLPLESALCLLDICSAAGVGVVFDPVAYALALRYRQSINRFALITPNAIEAQALTGLPVSNVDQAIRAAKRLVRAGAGVAVITLAGMGVVYATADGSGHVPAFDVEIIDTTGASDALTATIMYGILNQLQIDEAVRLGVSAATLTLQTSDTVYQDLSLESLYAQLVI